MRSFGLLVACSHSHCALGFFSKVAPCSQSSYSNCCVIFYGTITKGTAELLEVYFAMPFERFALALIKGIIMYMSVIILNYVLLFGLCFF